MRNGSEGGGFVCSCHLLSGEFQQGREVKTMKVASQRKRLRVEVFTNKCLPLICASQTRDNLSQQSMLASSPWKCPAAKLQLRSPCVQSHRESVSEVDDPSCPKGDLEQDGRVFRLQLVEGARKHGKGGTRQGRGYLVVADGVAGERGESGTHDGPWPGKRRGERLEGRVDDSRLERASALKQLGEEESPGPRKVRRPSLARG